MVSIPRIDFNPLYMAHTLYEAIRHYQQGEKPQLPARMSASVTDFFTHVRGGMDGKNPIAVLEKAGQVFDNLEDFPLGFLARARIVDLDR